MNYEFFETPEANENCEMPEKGVLHEHYAAPERDITETVEFVEIYGTPDTDAAVWVKAENSCSDSLLCEQYASELLTGTRLSEYELCAAAGELGYYNIEYGCTLYETGKYLESLDLEIIRESSLTVNDVCQALENGEKVICAVSSITLYYPEISGMPGLSADCMIQVIGVDMSNPCQKVVILNSPLAEQSAVEIPLEKFLKAWQKSECYAVTASVKRNG